MSEDATVVHDPEAHRYRLLLEGAEVGELTYRALGERKVAFLHTGVQPELQGGGLGNVLVAAAVHDARRHGLEIVPVCPFVAAYIRRHPEPGGPVTT